jgi:amidase
MADLAFASATSLAAAIRRKRLGCRELLEHFLARIERLNPKLNAVVTLDAEHARRQVTTPTPRSRAAKLGPLHGVPMTIKDSSRRGACARPRHPPLAGTTSR